MSSIQYFRSLRRFAVACTATGALLLAAGSATAQTAPAGQPTAAAKPPSRIAVVDVRRAVLETEEGLRIQATLKKLFDSRQVELTTREEALALEKDDLDKKAQSGAVGQQELQKQYEQLNRRAAELQQLLVQYEGEMRRKEQELTQPVLQKMLDVVKEIAKQERFDMVLEKSTVPFVREELDLTDRAIQMFNSGQVGKPATPNN